MDVKCLLKEMPARCFNFCTGYFFIIIFSKVSGIWIFSFFFFFLNYLGGGFLIEI